MRDDIAIDWSRVCAITQEPMGNMDQGYSTAVYFDGGLSLFFWSEHLSYEEALQLWAPHRRS